MWVYLALSFTIRLVLILNIGVCSNNIRVVDHIAISSLAYIIILIVVAVKVATAMYAIAVVVIVVIVVV